MSAPPPVLPCEPYQYAVAGRALRGEAQSGDAALVHASADGVLVAVVDGLGHGDEAAAAAAAAIRTLREHADEPVAALLQRCHETLRPTRGAAMAVAAIDFFAGTLTWSGVGNVEGILTASRSGPCRPKLYLTNRSGVVGYHLPETAASVAPIFPGDLLILATDGIDDRFTLGDLPGDVPDVVARAILDRYGKATDDALVLVLRWQGADADKDLGDAP